MSAPPRPRWSLRVKQLALRTGLYSSIRALAPHRGVAILRYHAVTDPATCEYASSGICTPVTEFEQQVAYLATRYRVLPLPDIAVAYGAGRSLPSNAVAITFDDGYADNLEAARILARHGATATFYLTAGCIGDGQPFWPSEVRYLLARLRTPDVVLASGARSIDLSPAAAGHWQRTSREVNRLFKSVPIPERERLREQLRAVVGAPPMPSPMLTWDQVREMHALGMTIGGHTMTHPNLPSAGLEEATRELREARARLEAETGAPVTMMSYPNGGAEVYFTPELKRVAAELGYACATTSRNGLAGPGSDLFAMERVSVAGTLPELVFRLEVERFAFRPASDGRVSE